MKNKIAAMLAAGLLIAGAFALATGVPEAEATGGGCGTPIPVSPNTLTLGSYSHTGQEGSAAAFAQGWLTAYGLNSRTTDRWTFDDTVWPQVVTNLASMGASSNGTVVEAQLYTDHASTSTTLTANDIKGISLFVRSWGNYYHRFYAPDGQGGFVEDPSMRDEMSAQYDATDMWWISDGAGSQLALDSTMYRLEWDNAQRWDWLAFVEDIDPGARIVGALGGGGAQASSIPEIGESDPTGGGFGTPDPAGRKCHDNAACKNSVNQVLPACSSTTLQCWDGEDPTWEDICPLPVMAANSSISVPTQVQLDTMYGLRDLLLASPSTAKYAAGYYVITVVDSNATEAQRVAAYNNALGAADVVMNGLPTDVVVTPAVYSSASALVTAMLGQHNAMDTVLNEVQAKLDANQGKTRAVFCADIFGAADCNL